MVQYQTLASDLADLIQKTPGVLSLVGDHGGEVLITGEVTKSGIMPGCISIETEVGTLYIGAEDTLTVHESD